VKQVENEFPHKGAQNSVFRGHFTLKKRVANESDAFKRKDSAFLE
jgi:hypothetical protein